MGADLNDLIAQLTQAIAESEQALTDLAQAHAQADQAANQFQNTVTGTNLQDVTDAAQQTRTTADATLPLAAEISAAAEALRAYRDRLIGKTPTPTSTTGEERPEDPPAPVATPPPLPPPGHPTELPGMPHPTPAITRPDHIPADAAPFSPETAAAVPHYGGKGPKATGVAVLEDGKILPPQDSGRAGPALRVPKPRPGMNGNLVTHVEAHTVAAMHEHGSREATLYVNRQPCRYPTVPGEEWGCDVAIPIMLRPGEKLTVYAPAGYVRVFHGKVF